MQLQEKIATLQVDLALTTIEKEVIELKMEKIVQDCGQVSVDKMMLVANVAAVQTITTAKRKTSMAEATVAKKRNYKKRNKNGG